MFQKDDLQNLDIEGGQCVNASVPQTVTFGLQGTLFGIDLDGHHDDD